MDHLHDAAFLDTAMGMSPLGTAETVSALGLDGAKNFYGRSLAGSRVVVAGAGAVHQVCLLLLSSCVRWRFLLCVCLCVWVLLVCRCGTLLDWGMVWFGLAWLGLVWFSLVCCRPAGLL